MFAVLSVVARIVRRISPFGLVLLASCEGGSFGPFRPDPLEDAMTKGREITDYLAERQLEEAGSGSTIIGQGGPLTTPGRVSASLSGMRLSHSVPSLSGTAIIQSGIVPSLIAASNASATRLQLDVAMGVFRGFKLGSSRIFSVEMLGQLGMSGNYASNDLNLKQASGFSYGFGQRMGLLEETPRLPGIAFSSTYLTLPGLNWSVSNLPAGGSSSASIRVTDYSANIVGVRLTAQKSFGPAAITVGWGRDEVSANFTTHAQVDGPTAASLDGHNVGGGHRSTWFVGGAFRAMRGAHIAGEVIRSTAVDAEGRFNKIGGGVVSAATRVRLGVRVGGQ